MQKKYKYTLTLEYTACLLFMNMCRPRKWGKWMKAVTSLDLVGEWMCTNSHRVLHGCTISAWCPHVESLFYLVTQNQVKYVNQVKQSTGVAETFKLRRAHSNHQLSTSTRWGRPCYRKAYTHFLGETTHLPQSHLSSFHFQVTLQEVCVKLMAKFTLH